MKLSNESYFSLNFMVRRSRPNKEGEFPILLRITMNGQRAEVYTCLLYTSDAADE